MQNSKKRVRLSKWSLRYLRSCDVSKRLAALEDELEEQGHPEDDQEATEILRRSVERIFAQRLGYPEIENLAFFESMLKPILQRKANAVILRANSTRYITSYFTQTIKAHAQLSQWEDVDTWDGRYFVQSNEEMIVHIEPVAKVVYYLTSGAKDRLSAYAKSVIRQSLTSNA